MLYSDLRLAVHFSTVSVTRQFWPWFMCPQHIFRKILLLFIRKTNCSRLMPTAEQVTCRSCDEILGFLKNYVASESQLSELICWDSLSWSNWCWYCLKLISLVDEFYCWEKCFQFSCLTRSSGRVLRPFLQRERLFTKLSRQLPIFPRMDVLAH